MRKPFKILPGVYLVGSSEISNPGDCMVYLVDCKSELALIDAGVSVDISKIIPRAVARGKRARIIAPKK